MRRRLAVILVTVMVSMTLAVSASAHNGGPCGDSGGPGNSDYATHHIAFLAKPGPGSIGGGGHVPGVIHQGSSACIPGITTGPPAP